MCWRKARVFEEINFVSLCRFAICVANGLSCSSCPLQLQLQLSMSILPSGFRDLDQRFVTLPLSSSHTLSNILTPSLPPSLSFLSMTAPILNLLSTLTPPIPPSRLRPHCLPPLLLSPSLPPFLPPFISRTPLYIYS